MAASGLTPYSYQGLTLLGENARSSRVSFAFTGRTGGVSQGPYASLNLHEGVGDSPQAVARNRELLFEALGIKAYADKLIVPKQVHGTTIVTLRQADAQSWEAAERAAVAGADAVVCTVPEVPVMLLYADCVPVVLSSQRGFAVIHSGWRGTIECISQLALEALCEAADVAANEVTAFIGPHIGVADYEVSPELVQRFTSSFGSDCIVGERNLSLEYCVRAALANVGSCVSAGISTTRDLEHYYSYRGQGGVCGRHAAIAWMSAE